MHRREFISVLGSAAAWPLVARGQPTVKRPRVGVLWHAGNEQEEAIYLGALRQGLSDVGYIEGKNIELLNRFADEHYERFYPLAKELVEAKVDLIIAVVAASVLAAKRATTSIPIVFIGAADPVGSHLVDSLAHPGGNVTGLSPIFTDLTGKQLEILKDCLLGLSSAVLLINPNSPTARALVQDAQTAGRATNISISVVEAGNPDDLTKAFADIAQQRPGAVIVGVDGMFYNERKRIAHLAIRANFAVVESGGFPRVYQ